MKHTKLGAAVLQLLVALACASGGADTAGRMKILINVDENGMALQGYDPVGYFTNMKPIKGDPQFQSTYDGGIYYFASADHKTMFDADPAKYEPQFGGYCGYAASINKVSPIEVEWFQILDGHLVLQHNAKAWKSWNEDVPGNLKKAHANWPGLIVKKGKPVVIG